MILGGEQLVKSEFRHYPPSIPLLAVHGTADKAIIFTFPIFFERSNSKLNLCWRIWLTFTLPPAGDLPQSNWRTREQNTG